MRSNHILLPSYGSDSGSFSHADPLWAFRPLNLLDGMDLFDYFLRAVEASGFIGTIEHYNIQADKPTVWHIKFASKDGQTREIEVEHEDLTPDKLRELLH